MQNKQIVKLTKIVHYATCVAYSLIFLLYIKGHDFHENLFFNNIIWQCIHFVDVLFNNFYDNFLNKINNFNIKDIFMMA